MTSEAIKSAEPLFRRFDTLPALDVLSRRRRLGKCGDYDWPNLDSGTMLFNLQLESAWLIHLFRQLGTYLLYEYF
jgi:hypothetical protein